MQGLQEGNEPTQWVPQPRRPRIWGHFIQIEAEVPLARPPAPCHTLGILGGPEGVGKCSQH